MVALPDIFHFDYPTFGAAATISMFIVILATPVKTSALSAKVDSRRLGDGLRADMLSSGLAPVSHISPKSASAQSFALVAITEVKSPFLVATGGLILIVVTTSSGFGTIPIVLRVFYHQFSAGFGTIFHLGISSSALMAITLNLLFNHLTAGNPDQHSVFDADGNEVPVTPEAH